MKLYPLIFFLCCFAIPLFSQEIHIKKWEDKGKLSIGCELGLNRTYMIKGVRKDDSIFKYDKVNGYKASVFASYNWSNKWGALYAVEYERKGAALKNNFNELHRLHYVGLSMAPTYSYKRFHAYMGLYAAYLLGATDEIDENKLFLAVEADKFFPFDAGLKLGVGVSFLKRFSLYLNHDMGLATIYSTPEYGITGSSFYGFLHRRNRSFSLSLRTTFKELQLKKPLSINDN